MLSIKLDCNLCFLGRIFVSPDPSWLTRANSPRIRYGSGISDPILGPPGVQLLLMSRGFFGYALDLNRRR